MYKKIEGLENARENFNRYQGRAVLFVDFSDNTAWCEVFDIPRYHSEDIIAVVGKDDLHGRDDKYGRDKLGKIVALKESKRLEGWTREMLEDDYYLAEELYYL